MNRSDHWLRPLPRCGRCGDVVRLDETLPGGPTELIGRGPLCGDCDWDLADRIRVRGLRDVDTDATNTPRPVGRR